MASSAIGVVTFLKTDHVQVCTNPQRENLFDLFFGESLRVCIPFFASQDQCVNLCERIKIFNKADCAQLEQLLWNVSRQNYNSIAFVNQQVQLVAAMRNRKESEKE